MHPWLPAVLRHDSSSMIRCAVVGCVVLSTSFGRHWGRCMQVIRDVHNHWRSSDVSAAFGASKTTSRRDIASTSSKSMDLDNYHPKTRTTILGWFGEDSSVESVFKPQCRSSVNNALVAQIPLLGMLSSLLKPLS